MATVWRILLKKDIPTSPDYGEYCLKNKIAAMGWILEKHNSDIANGTIKINNFADFETCAKIEGINPSQICILAEKIKAGDFIWTYVDGIYYLAQVSTDSRYIYNTDAEAMAYRACNQLTNIDWKAVGKYKDVDKKIANRMQMGRTLCKLFAEDNPDFIFALQYTQKIFAQLNEPNFDDDVEVDTADEMIKQMDSAISRFDLPDNVIFGRLADISLIGFFQKVLADDGFFQDAGFTDTSALHINAPDKNFIELKIFIPKGTGRGAWFAPMSPFPEECQFTLNRGTIYKVLEISRNDSEIWQVSVAAIGRCPKELD